MKTSNKVIKISIALAIATSFCQSANAAWNDGGYNVVFFDTSVNPQKIVYAGAVRPTELPGVLAADYNALRDIALASAPYRINPNTNFLIGSRIIKPAQVEAKLIEDANKHAQIYSNVATGSTPAACNPGNTNCASVGLVLVSQTCNHQTVTVSGAIEVGISNPAGDAEVGATGSVTASWERGWQTCQGAGNWSGCNPVYSLNYKSENYPTIETYSKFNNFEFKVIGDRIDFRITTTPADLTANANYCRNQLGGTYGESAPYGMARPERGSRCTSITNKPRYKKFVRMPNQTGSVNYAACRLLRK